MRRFGYLAPRTLPEAVQLLSEHASVARVLAGGTDLVVQMKDGARRPEVIIDITGIDELRVLEEREDGLHLGALVRMGEIEDHPVIIARYPVLVDAARLVGSRQVRNLATIAGNTCNASPGADTPPALIALGARVYTLGPNGPRVIPIDQFFVGPGKTVLSPGELVTKFVVPRPGPNEGAYYERHTPRRELDIAVVGVGAWVKLAGEVIADTRIGIAAVYPTPLRATEAEAALRGQPFSAAALEAAAQAAVAQSQPISDVRGSAEFRRWLVDVLTRRAVTNAVARARGGGPRAGETP
ncbi:MAG: xanthine dehydrogenase family protein subunit M [Chloroflexi bacterium]|nr:xanthine dehydrogenase family protein subunit M [Chloroflexota bacterium]